MTQEQLISETTVLVNQQIADQPSLFLVAVKVKPTNNIKVYLDGDQGITIDACVKINRAVYRKMEELAWFPEGDFSLEVSSPGIDEPLKLLRQYYKNIGRNVEVILTDGTRYEGKLDQVSDVEIQLICTSGKGKKAIVTNQLIGIDAIKQTKVLLAF